MKKRGFTLIELLAVIVILAIIALIATPIVMSVIENARKGAAERSTENYIRAVETTVATERLNGNPLEGAYLINADGNLCAEVDGVSCLNPVTVDVSGNKPSGGNIQINDDGKIGVHLYIKGYCSIKEYGTNEINVTKTTEELCFNSIPDIMVKNSNEVNVLASGNMALTNYKIYGNNVQNGTPTTGAPVEIESVGDKTKNLFDKDTAQVLNLTMSNGGFVTSSTAKTIYIPCKASTTYTISRLSGNSFTVANSIEKPADGITYSIDGKSSFVNFNDNVTEGVYTTSASAKYLAVIITGASAAHTPEEIMESMQIEEGSTATEYEPYGYKIPVTVSGKNLFNKDTVNTTRHLSNGSTQFGTGNIATYNSTDFIPVKPNTTYIKSGDFGANVQAYFDSNKNFIGSATMISAGTAFTTPSNCAYIVLNVTVSNAPYSTAQLEEGSTVTEYEPYIQSTTNIYLDEPLRCVGSVCDYIDYNNKQVVRNVNVIDDSGEKTIEESFEELSTPEIKKIDLPEINLYKGNNKITIGTRVTASKIEISY